LFEPIETLRNNLVRLFSSQGEQGCGSRIEVRCERDIVDHSVSGIPSTARAGAIEEHLDTEWLHGENNVDEAAVAQILNYPNAIIGLSDGGAHVQFQSGFGFSTRLLSEWVRDKQIMSLETAVRRLTFESASTFGLHDRGLLRPGMVADIVIFDPDTVKPLPLEVVHDFPTGAKRIKEPAQGIHMTIVNGQAQWITAGAFATPSTPSFGNMRRNQLTAPGYGDVDLSVFKNTKFEVLGHDLNAQFRAEMFNLFNRANYAPPDNYLSDGSAFGTVTQTIGYYNGAPGIGPGEPFNTQFALKILF